MTDSYTVIHMNDIIQMSRDSPYMNQSCVYICIYIYTYTYTYTHTPIHTPIHTPTHTLPSDVYFKPTHTHTQTHTHTDLGLGDELALKRSQVQLNWCQGIVATWHCVWYDSFMCVTWLIQMPRHCCDVNLFILCLFILCLFILCLFILCLFILCLFILCTQT